MQKAGEQKICANNGNGGENLGLTLGKQLLKNTEPLIQDQIIAEHGGGKFMGERSSSDSVINNIHVVGKKPGDTSSSMESPLQQSNEDEDITPPNPYNELGFGFTAYFNLLRTLIWLFVLST